MRQVAGLMLAAGLLWAGPATCYAGEREDALALIEAALKAHGGEEKMARTASSVRKDTGLLSAYGKDVPLADELTLSLPDRSHMAVEVGTDARKARIIEVLNGDKGWRDNGATTTDLPKERVEELRENCFMLWVGTLVPLKKDSAFQFALLPEEKVNGQPAAGIKVSHKDHPDCKLYFDKKTGLLVKMTWHGKESGIEVDKDYYYSEHKDFDGVKFPTRITEMLNGKKFVDLAVESYKFLPQVDDSLFAKP
jgi:hypothetical protein